MREILFRAKTVDTNEWKYGYYTSNGEDGWIERIETDNPDFWEVYLVNPETLGQFTGLYDKNGARVFEGDILKIYKKSDAPDPYYHTYYHPKIPYPCKVVMKWDMDFGAWMWETMTKNKRYIYFPDAWRYYSCEVIGNIYDNRELLKEGTE